MLSDTEFTHRLDVALAPITRSFQHAIPFSERLGEFGNTRSDSQVLQATTTTASSHHYHSYTTNTINNNNTNNNSVGDGEVVITDAALQNIARVECETCVEGLHQWLRRAQEGRQMGKECLNVLNSLSSCLSSMRDVTGAVQEQSNHLSSNASALMVRKTKLEMVREELQRMINHFSRIEVLTREAEQPTLSATSARYSSMLQEMEEEMQFLSRNSQFLSSKAYATKLAVAQQRAFQCLKDAIVESLSSAQNAAINSTVYKEAFTGKKQQTKLDLSASALGSVSMVAAMEESALDMNTSTPLPIAGIHENSEGNRIASETLDRINSVFRNKLSEKASLRRMLEARGGEGQPEDEMNDGEILDVYRDTRVAIVGPLLQNWLEASCGDDTNKNQMSELVSHLASLMKVALAREKEVFDDVWLREDFGARVFPQLVAGISDEVYHVFRSRLLQVDELDELAQSIEEIQRAIAKQDSIAELSGLFTKMIQDAQERLVFRTSVFLRQSIIRCVPTKAMVQEFCSSETIDEEIYIPALNNCVTLLRLLYPSLELSVFSVFAEEAIHCTLIQVQELAKMMGQVRGEHNVLKGIMCQLRHLLHLREELSRIDENITVVEKHIDLSKIAQRRLEIVQSSRESKKDVESEIKLCCEHIVQMLFTDVSTPLAGIARKKPEEIQIAVRTAEQKWSDQQQLLAVFITDASTRDILLRPVRVRLDELLREIASIQLHQQIDNKEQLQSQQQQQQQQQRIEEISVMSTAPGNTVVITAASDGRNEATETIQQQQQQQEEGMDSNVPKKVSEYTNDTLV
ncbi:Conserved oligomeric Golgi complex [Trypanosoma melophagium]|uniref:Conserved oligomeric Golgi complex n=1 Tax=Trypanosoma melophagium TaxID=715481 RepID=UPI00351A758B|nr:Conserved oligomeric Golgi complex [Trypanosoma melophagium]